MKAAILRIIRNGKGWSMIVCSCNVLSDHDVRSAVQTAAPHTTGEVYGCLGCSAQCGRCARSIRKIMDEALAGAGGTAGCAACPALACTTNHNTVVASAARPMATYHSRQKELHHEG